MKLPVYIYIYIYIHIYTNKNVFFFLKSRGHEHKSGLFGSWYQCGRGCKKMNMIEILYTHENRKMRAVESILRIGGEGI
jgi:hypothetical protein